MADKKTLAKKRLLGKLSALRQTLRGDERTVLDEFVLGIRTAGQSEVEAHSMTVAGKALQGKSVQSKSVQSRSAQGKMLLQKDSDLPEVAAHSMTAPSDASQGARMGKSVQSKSVQSRSVQGKITLQKGVYNLE